MKEMVNNVPSYAWEIRCWVVREVDGELWFYGAYNESQAEEVAAMVDGWVIED